jgi:hypothetical protein
MFSGIFPIQREEKGEGYMESTVAALLFVTATVVLSCVAVVYSVEMVQQTFDGSSTQMQMIQEIQDTIMNQTAILNGTIANLPEPTVPTASPAP